MEHNDPSRQLISRTIVNPSQYEANAAKINQLKQLVAQMEQRNETGYVRYQLEEKIRAGQQAQDMLAQLAEIDSSVQQPADIVNASTSMSAANTGYSDLDLTYPMDAPEYATVPTTASIEEVKSPAQNTRSYSKRSSNGSAHQYSYPSASSGASSTYRGLATNGDSSAYYYPHVQPNTVYQNQAHTARRMANVHGNSATQMNPTSQYYRTAAMTSNAYPAYYAGQNVAQNWNNTESYHQSHQQGPGPHISSAELWAQFAQLQQEARNAQRHQNAASTSSGILNGSTGGSSSLDGALGNRFSSSANLARSGSPATVTSIAHNTRPAQTSRTATPTTSAPALPPSVPERPGSRPRSRPESRPGSASAGNAPAPVAARVSKSDLAKTLMSEYRHGHAESVGKQAQSTSTSINPSQQSASAMTAPKASAVPAAPNATLATFPATTTTTHQSQAGSRTTASVAANDSTSTPTITTLTGASPASAQENLPRVRPNPTANAVPSTILKGTGMPSAGYLIPTTMSQSATAPPGVSSSMRDNHAVAPPGHQHRPGTAQSHPGPTQSFNSQASVISASPAPLPVTQSHPAQPSAPATSTSQVSAPLAVDAQTAGAQQSQADGASQLPQSKSAIYYSYPGLPYQQYRYMPYHQNLADTVAQNRQGYSQLAAANVSQTRLDSAAFVTQALQQSSHHRSWRAYDATTGRLKANDVVHTRPPSPRTPAKAEKKTLARDILRSLGRPLGRSLIRPAESGGVSEDNVSATSAGPSSAAGKDGEEGSDSEPEAPAASLQEIEDAQETIAASSTEYVGKAAEPFLDLQQESSLPKRKKDGVADTISGEEVSRKRQRLDEVIDNREVSQPPIAVLPNTSPDESEAAESRERVIVVTPRATANPKSHSKAQSTAGQSADPSQGSDKASLGKPVSQRLAVFSRSDNVPLFLPSPSSSPSATPSGRGTSEHMQISTSSRKRKRGRPRVFFDYVLVPPLPPSSMQHWKKKPVTGSDSVVLEDDRTTRSGRETPAATLPVLRDEALEESAFIEACSRLSVRRCHWESCDAVLNSVDNLLRHLFLHQDNSGDYVCRWNECTDILSSSVEFDKHLEDHAADPLPCAYLGCYSEFRTRSELLQHNLLKHRNSTLKPQPDPFAPQSHTLESITDHEMSLQLPSPLYTSYLSVSPYPISSARHAQIGPWVLRRIFGPVNLQHAQYNAAAPLRASRRLANAEPDPKSTLARIQYSRHDEYDFAKASTLDPPDFCDDLPSHEVTKLVSEGLVFWDSNSTTDVEIKQEDDRALAYPEPASPSRWPTENASHAHQRPDDPVDGGASSASSDELRLRDNDFAEPVVSPSAMSLTAGCHAGHSGPVYISSHSAEVILSEIRPIKLKVDALSSINVFLDELLWNVLSASRSLTTEKLKAGLTKVLPTPLGKEALLEAEVELRAYWERTSASTPSSPKRPGDDEKTFNLDLAFELLRLKCQAYSTLNDADEDPEAESRLYDRLLASGQVLVPPKPALLSPAALYLTAILESICEHVLANVGRVAARDSSRSTATVHDLHIALCEDDAIYGLFKTMRVFEQIETMSRPRRSKSFSRSSDKLGSPLTAGSPSQDPQSRMRLSSESASTAHANGNPGNIAAASASRPSFEKSRALKIFTSHNRSSSDQNRAVNEQAESQSGHKKMDSIHTLSKQALVASGDRTATPEIEDEDFDELMRSGATMKVSLTPDRLRTMEVLNKERNRRENAAKSSKPTSQDATQAAVNDPEESSSLNPKRSHGSRKPTLRHVDSIIEDDEENHGLGPSPKPPRSNGYAQPQPMPSRTSPNQNFRLRSISTSNTLNKPSMQGLNRKASLNAMSSAPMQSVSAPFKKERPMPKQLDLSNGGPPRTRKVGRRRESLDLDDIMNGSDEEGEVDTFSAAPKTPKTPKSAHPAVTSRTRELIDFLSEGPPDMPPLPKTASVVSFETTKSVGKPSGLRRMISKLSKVGSTEHLNGHSGGRINDDGMASLSRRLPAASATSTSLAAPSLSSKRSYQNVVVGTRPPRYGQGPASPPPSSPSLGSSEGVTPPSSYSRRTAPSRDPSDLTMTSMASSIAHIRADNFETTKPVSIDQSSIPSRGQLSLNTVDYSEEDSTNTRSPSRTLPTPPPSHIRDTVTPDAQVKDSPPVAQLKATSERPRSKKGRADQTLKEDQSANSPPSDEEVKDLRRLLSKATSADECRLLIDMLLLKCGFKLDEEPAPAAYPSPSPSIDTPIASHDSDLEQSLVELLLSGSAADTAIAAVTEIDAASGSEPRSAPHTINSPVPMKVVT
ncbi:hypothetical protein OE88DRAFT_1738950 [Heliocybe sulcata]|uniref:C2H2-type domain-containing protein n=1 Tax=Heliocybe sulcata TaxID=5364 RepID=A0A5C3MRA1_9AGAM|nr:hypothetical protein OE88DRAFT_1738950 [Heliocybe sulcata]